MDTLIDELRRASLWAPNPQTADACNEVANAFTAAITGNPHALEALVDSTRRHYTSNGGALQALAARGA